MRWMLIFHFEEYYARKKCVLDFTFWNCFEANFMYTNLYKNLVNIFTNSSLGAVDSLISLYEGLTNMAAEILNISTM